MRIAIITDIHANLPALQAVLRDIRRHAPDIILSLGDQINLGPSPRETLALLGDAGARCLHGNHEGYVLGAMAGDARFAGANFESLRFNASLLRAEEITFEQSFQFGAVTFCHAMPGDDRFPLFDPTRALPLLRALRPQTPLHVVCGHAHNPRHYALPGLTVDVIGSAGCMDEGTPGVANYAVADIDETSCVLTPYAVAYDTSALWELFVKSGMADYCPVMSRIVCYQMRENRVYLLPFLDIALPLSASRGESHVSRETWLDADARFPWPDGRKTADFWRKG